MSRLSDELRLLQPLSTLTWAHVQALSPLRKARTTQCWEVLINLHLDGNVQLHSGAAAEATSVTQVIDLLPVEHHQSLFPELLQITDKVTKAELVTNQINCLCVDKIAQQIPNFLHSCKLHTVQFSKSAWTTLPNLSKVVVEGHKEYLFELLDAIIKEKEKEECQPQASLNIITITNHLYETITMVHSDLEKSCMIPKDTKKLLNEAMREDKEPELIPAPHVEAIYSSLLHKIPNLITHIIVLSHTYMVTEENKQKKKKELKDVATATAREFIPNKNKSSIAKMVMAQVKQQMNAKGPKPGKGAKGGKKKKDTSGGNPKKKNSNK
ncbi:hypothetical protein F5J12DRAFT_888316 [Pisolithus orientalis]|uniref:uncharacterized protein n=1 Tax=Pisolithus orientalis TaxID=936130 RepID=UPI00222564B1|nr:uncharacterized protein F5J12DRAFT_888316 [Pisolithus orientalis]KAI6030514.1 hypothetical protein F5J12DRAFT_888316 [Pisolithus orientalis]